MLQTLRSRLELNSLRQLLAASISTRLVVDTTTQLFNPYLAIFAAGTGVGIITMGRLLSLRGFVGILAPLFGTLADRFGYRTVLRLGLLTGAAGMFLIGISTNVWMLTIGMLLNGLGISSFVPVLQAYMSAKLPYERRAQGIGILEYSWALASIVGLFAMGFVIDSFGWRAPFFILGVGLLFSWLVMGLLPSAREERAAVATPGVAFSWRDLPHRFVNFFRLGENSRSAYAVIASHALLFFAAFHIIITHGGWLEIEYGLSASVLGTIALIQGFADLGGSVSVSLFTDRLGKKRAVLGGMICVTLVFALLPFLNVGVAAAVVGLALMRLSFEFTIVGDISLISEQVPAQRGKVMALGVAVSLIGATLAGLTGPWAYSRFGVWGLGPVSAVCAALAAVVLALWVREQEEERSGP